MKKIKKIAVSLVEGCDISGGETAMEVLGQNISFDVHVALNPDLKKEERPLYLSAITDLTKRLKDTVSQSLEEDYFPLVFGGDHALGIGSIAGHQNGKQSVLWIDAHGDCNTDISSDSQRIHGMPLAVLMGHGHPALLACVDAFVRPENIMLVGTRSLDEEEQRLMDAWGVSYMSMEKIREEGSEKLLSHVQDFINKAESLHVSFDCDSMDPKDYPGVNTPVAGGFSWDEVKPVLDMVLKTDKLSSFDIVEFNPVQDRNQETENLVYRIHQMIEEALEK